MTGPVDTTQEAGEGALQVQVAALAAGGLTQDRIAERMGLGQATVSRIMVRVRKTWRENASASYEDLLAREYAYLEDLRSKLHDGVARGDFKNAEAATRLSERVSRLMGLDHADRMNERMVRVSEAQTQMVAVAIGRMLDHLGLEPAQRDEAITFIRGELAGQEQKL